MLMKRCCTHQVKLANVYDERAILGLAVKFQALRRLSVEDPGEDIDPVIQCTACVPAQAERATG
jgi:hypothetical protein